MTDDQSNGSQSLLLMIGKMDGKLDIGLSNDTRQDLRLTSMEARMNDLASKIEFDLLVVRVHSLEGWRSRAIGMITVITALLATATNYVVNHILVHPFWK